MYAASLECFGWCADVFIGNVTGNQVPLGELSPRAIALEIVHDSMDSERFDEWSMSVRQNLLSSVSLFILYNLLPRFPIFK